MKMFSDNTCILVSGNAISGFWEDALTLQLFAYLLHCADTEGYVKVNSRHISNAIRQSRYRVERGIRLLENANLISQKSAKNQPMSLLIHNTLPHLISQKSAKNQPKISAITTRYEDWLSSFADTFNNKVCGTCIPQIRGLSDARRRNIKILAKEYGDIMVLEQVIDKAVESDFLSGRKSDFHASFDWIFKKTNFIKILEGNYDNGTTKQTATANSIASRAESRRRLSAIASEILSRDTDIILNLYDDKKRQPDISVNQE